jgi:zinc transporter ZupT
MIAILRYRMTESLRYRTVLVLARLCGCGGIVASLIWVYVLFYSQELPKYDLRVIAVLTLMLALTAASFHMARFAKKRLMAIGSANYDT